MTNYIANASGSGATFKSNLESVKNYMRYRNMPEEVQVNVVKYFDYLWSVLGGVDEGHILHEVPPALRTQIEVRTWEGAGVALVWCVWR